MKICWLSLFFQCILYFFYFIFFGGGRTQSAKYVKDEGFVGVVPTEDAVAAVMVAATAPKAASEAEVAHDQVTFAFPEKELLHSVGKGWAGGLGVPLLLVRSPRANNRASA